MLCFHKSCPLLDVGCMQATKEVRETRSEHYAWFGEEFKYSGSDDSCPEVDWESKMHAATEKAKKDAVVS